MSKIKLLSDISEIEDTLYECSFTPLYDFKLLFEVSRVELITMLFYNKDGKHFWFEIEKGLSLPDSDGDISDESEIVYEIIYKSEFFKCGEAGFKKAFSIAKQWIKEKQKELNAK